MRACNTADERLFAFVDGLDESLDEHVAGCDECQAFLADLWAGELAHDITGPVMRQIRFEKFMAELARFGLGVAADMGKGAVAFTIGSD